VLEDAIDVLYALAKVLQTRIGFPLRSDAALDREEDARGVGRLGGKEAGEQLEAEGAVRGLTVELAGCKTGKTMSRFPS